MVDIQLTNRKLTGNERFFGWSPYSTVTLVARIYGNITQQMLEDAVKKAQQRHPYLRMRIDYDENHVPWLVSDNVEDIPIESIDRKSKDQWMEEVIRSSKMPYDFHIRPAIRFLLVRTEEVSELMILCHHVICDGMSLAYLMRDMLSYLGDPSQEVVALPPATPIQEDIFPDDISTGRLTKWVVNKRINPLWAKEIVHFNHEDYVKINDLYWENFNHKIISVELDEKQTKRLVTKCREEDVTVNSAIITAFAGAQKKFQDKDDYNPEIIVAASVRDRLKEDPGEGFGFYAGGINKKIKYRDEKSVWENARVVHKTISKMYTNKNLFSECLVFEYIDPSIWEARNFKVLGNLLTNGGENDKIKDFSTRNDTVSALLKRSKMDSLDKTIAGTAITNLRNFAIPTTYGELELDRMFLHPGGGFPLVTVPLVLGVITSAGKLTIILDYAEEAIDTDTMVQIKEHAMQLLLD